MNEESNQIKSHREASGAERVTKTAIVLIIATTLVRLLSLLKEIVIASRFGVSAEMDAYNVAAAVVMMLIAVMIPAITGTIIPLLSNVELHFGQGSTKTRQAWGTVFVGSSLALLLTTVLLISGSDLLKNMLELLARALGSTMRASFAQPLTRTLLIILAPLVLLQGLATTMTCLFHIHKRFLLPALAGAAFPLTIICALLIHPAPEVEWMAKAAVVGSFLVTVLLLPYYRRSAALITLPDKELLGRFGRNLLPLILVMVFAHLSECLVYLMGYSVSVGGASSLGYAHRLVDMPTLLIGVSFTAVVFPFFSDSVAQGQMEKLAGLFHQTMKQLVTLMVPVTIAWFVFGRRILESFYEQGIFGEAATEMTLLPLLMFALGGTFKTIMFLEGRLFMALGMIRILVYFGLGHLVLNASLAIFLGRTMGHSGLALALSIAYAVVSLALFVLSVKRLSPYLRPVSVMVTTCRAMIAAATAGTLVWWLLTLMPPASGLAGLLQLAVGGTIYGAIYLLTGKLVGTDLRIFNIRNK